MGLLKRCFFSEKFGVEDFDKATAAFNSTAKIVGMQLTRLYEKGRISDADREFYLSLMPNLRMSEAAAEANTKELIRLLEQKLSNQVKELKTGQVENQGQSTGNSYQDYLNAIQ